MPSKNRQAPTLKKGAARPHRKQRGLTSFLLLTVLLGAVLLAPPASAAEVVSQINISAGASSTVRGYQISVEYVPSTETTYTCFSSKLGAGPAWAEQLATSTNHGASSSVSTLDGSNNDFGIQCSQSAEGVIHGILFREESYTTCNWRGIAGGAPTRIFTGASQCLGATAYFSATDYGWFHQDDYKYWNGSAQVEVPYPDAATASSSSLMFDADGVTMRGLVATNTGRLYGVVGTSFTNLVFSEIVVSGVSSNFTPDIDFAGTTYAICYETTGGLYRSTSTNFATWTPVLITTTPGPVNGCTVFAATNAVATVNRVWVDGDPIILHAGPDCAADGRERVGGYTLDGITLYIWNRECGGATGTSYSLIRTQIGDAEPGVGGSGGNPIGAAKEFFDDSWNLDPEVSNWLFAIAIVSLFAGAFLDLGRGNPFALMLGALLGIGLALSMGFLPIWFLLLVVFLIIAMASNKLFEDGTSADG